MVPGLNIFNILLYMGVFLFLEADRGFNLLTTLLYNGVAVLFGVTGLPARVLDETGRGGVRRGLDQLYSS